MRVKVCGIRTLREAMAAVEEGVHALGFVFASSPRQVTPEIAASIIKELPPFIWKVDVFVNERSGKVEEIAAYCGLDTLQFHEEETAAYCRLFLAYKVIKAFPASPSLAVENCREYRVSAILLDTAYAGKKGGGGLAFDWKLALPFRKGPFPLILAGGLHKDNVFNALNVVKPFGVDASSGVEKNGFKDRQKIRAFMEQVKRWECQH